MLLDIVTAYCLGLYWKHKNMPRPTNLIRASAANAVASATHPDANQVIVDVKFSRLSLYQLIVSH